MTKEQKDLLIEDAKRYINENNLSNNDVCRATKINSSYLSNMLRGQYHLTVDEKEVPIGDKWFLSLSEFISYNVDKVYWSRVKTRQFVEGISKLNECKNAGKTGLIIGGTGFGKSDFINSFCNKNPQHTFRVTVSSLYKLVDIVNELCDRIGIDVMLMNSQRIGASSLKIRVEKIIEKLKEIKRNGGLPIIIFDEGENLEIAVLKMLKALYDGLKDHCSMVIIGTDQLMNKLLNLKKRNRDAIPQLYRRFKAGYKHLSAINKEEEYPKFYEKMNVTDKGLWRLLIDLCDNYGELHDYLQPVLKEADQKNKPVTEELFRIYHDIKKVKP